MQRQNPKAIVYLAYPFLPRLVMVTYTCAPVHQVVVKDPFVRLVVDAAVDIAVRQIHPKWVDGMQVHVLEGRRRTSQLLSQHRLLDLVCCAPWGLMWFGSAHFRCHLAIWTAILLVAANEGLFGVISDVGGKNGKDLPDISICAVHQDSRAACLNQWLQDDLHGVVEKLIAFHRPSSNAKALELCYWEIAQQDRRI